MRKNKRGAACLTTSLGNQRGRFGDFQFADSLRACKTLLLAPLLRAIPLRRAEYVSSHTCQLTALGKKKKARIVVQSKINRPVESVGLIGSKI